MKRAKIIITRILYPPKWVLLIVPLISFAALSYRFVYCHIKYKEKNSTKDTKQ